MRNIKFRIYFKDEEPFMTEPISLEDLLHEDWIEFENKEGTLSLPLKDFRFFYSKNENYEIMQYTGLKDKNGKEIYEGDILELNKDGRIFYGTPDGLLAKKYQLVGFRDGAFMTCRNKHLIDDYDTYLWIISKYSTVAGNIYDNPELLEEGE